MIDMTGMQWHHALTDVKLHQQWKTPQSDKLTFMENKIINVNREQVDALCSFFATYSSYAENVKYPINSN